MSLQPADNGDLWSRLSADPRRPGTAEVRASTADRDAVAEVLAQAYADGRLDDAEYQERLGQALAVKRLGEVRPLVDDVVVSTGHRPAARATVASPTDRRAASLRAWLGMAVLFNLIWLLTWIGTGHPHYYWPMWPMLGTLVPAVIAYLSGPRSASGREIGR